MRKHVQALRRAILQAIRELSRESAVAVGAQLRTAVRSLRCLHFTAENFQLVFSAHDIQQRRRQKS